MKRAIPLVFLILAAGAVGTWLLFRDGGGGQPGSVNAPASHPLSTGTGTAVNTAPAGQAGAPKGVAPLTPPPEVSREYVAFLESDSRSLDSTHVDVSASLERVKQQAARMKDADRKFTRELVANPAAPANMRILGMFVLMNGGNASVDELCESTRTIPIDSKRAEVHSAEQVKNVQNKALVMMALDALAEQAATNSAARRCLEQAARDSADSTIAKHARERLAALPPGH